MTSMSCSEYDDGDSFEKSVNVAASLAEVVVFAGRYVKEIGVGAESRCIFKSSILRSTSRGKHFFTISRKLSFTCTRISVSA